jgi:hypothetical protein
VCYVCGQPLDEHNLAWDYPYPDTLWHMSDEDRNAAITFSSRMVIIAPGDGSFLKALLRIPLTNGLEASLGVWLAITDRELWDEVMAAARDDDRWPGISIRGYLTNAIQPWPQLFASPVIANPPGPGKVPIITGSGNPELRAVLADSWPEELMVAARDRPHVPGVLDPPAQPPPPRRRFFGR